MVQILPFAGWRYDLSQVGALSEVTAPSVNLINETLQRTLYRQHPCNAVRLVMNREEPGDTSDSNRAARSDEFWRLWKREGILLREHENAFYILETTYRLAGEERSRWSLIGRLRLPETETSTEQSLYSTLQVDPADVARQLELRRLTIASLTPIITLVEDTTGEDSETRSLSDHFESIVRMIPPVECIDDYGTHHRMWPITDQSPRTELAARLAKFSVGIIGGTVEFEAALKHRDELAAAGKLTDPNHPAHTVLACLVPSDDPGIEFLPRVTSIAGGGLSTEQIRNCLTTKFNCQFVGVEPNASEDATELARISHQQPCVAVGTHDGSWMIVNASAEAEASSDSLVKQIASIISEASASTVPNAQTILTPPVHYTDLPSWLKPLSSASENRLLIVAAPTSVSNVLPAMMGSAALKEDSLQLYPCVPTGLVFSSLEN